jgi:hypothetical protein
MVGGRHRAPAPAGVEYLPLTYADPTAIEPGTVFAGRDVLVLDFSFKRPVLERLRGSVASLRVLDHHASARAELRDAPELTFRATQCGAERTSGRHQ